MQHGGNGLPHTQCSTKQVMPQRPYTVRSDACCTAAHSLHTAHCILHIIQFSFKAIQYRNRPVPAQDFANIFSDFCRSRTASLLHVGGGGLVVSSPLLPTKHRLSPTQSAPRFPPPPVVHVPSKLRGCSCKLGSLQDECPGASRACPPP